MAQRQQPPNADARGVLLPDELNRRYTIGKLQGRGAYGAVYSATDNHRGGVTVALKRVVNVFRTADDALRTLRELSILRQCHHPCVVGVLSALEPPAGTEGDFDSVWLVMDHCKWDLGRLLAQKVSGWSMSHVGRIFGQMLGECATRQLPGCWAAPTADLFSDNSALPWQPACVTCTRPGSCTVT